MFLFYREEMETQLKRETYSPQCQVTSYLNQDTVNDIKLEDSDTEILDIDLVSYLYNT